MKKYIVIENNGKENHAGSKARNDIEVIALSEEYLPLNIRSFSINNILDRIIQFFIVLIDWIRILFIIKNNSTILIQAPMQYGQRYVKFYIKILKRIRKCNLIILIHDLDLFRRKKSNIKGELDFINVADHIICHNEKMKNILINSGIKENKLIPIDIFDYIADIPINNIEKKIDKSIIIAGNLSPSKSSYVYKINNVNINLKYNLYGPNYKDNKENKKNINYKGEFNPEELILKLDGSFGLIWDGEYIESCYGELGEYLKINNPHKTSLYLAAGIPVIIWEKAAMSDFILKENVGITIDSLQSIEQRINSITEDEYRIMRDNALMISEKLRSGYYSKSALQKSLYIKL